ncbi:MAG: universal stress protein [Ectothiorhodospiraceae bacterium]|nr:universal stress protein [Chromatiales bacterium]MCP5154385.1 universal stress protein [Ectothiorhodospiraceae bacterium]
MFRSILVPIDLDQESSWQRALPVADRMAHDHGARLHALTVLPGFGMSLVGSYFPADFERRAHDTYAARLESLVQQHCREPGGVTTHVRHGTIYAEILAAARELDCDLIVMASHRPALADYLLGPNAARVVRHADRSVFVVRG